MGFNEDYLKLRKKRLEEQQQKKSFVFESGPYQNATLTADDIAPVQSQKNVVIDDVDDIGKKNSGNESGLFKAGAFANGYQIGDITKTILGTAGDVASGLVQGVAGIGEGLGDLVMYGVAGVQDLVGKDDDAERLRDATKDDIIAPLFDSLRKKTNIDDNSLLGDFGYGIAQGVGQVGAIIATGGAGSAAGLGTVGTSALTTGMIGASSMGSGMSEAYQGGATDKEALGYGAMKGVIDAGTEMIFGGLGKSVKALGVSKGLTSIDDVFAKKLSSKMSSQFFKNATEYGVKATAEGLEEVLAGLGSAAAKKLTYMSDEELSQLVEDENLLEQFAAGALVSGIAQGGDLVKSTKQGRDYITNFSGNEETVIEKVYNDRVAEAEQDGKKLTNKEKNKLYEQVQADMRKGYISTDDIESVLGGETYKSYKDTVDGEDAILKEFDELGKKQNATLAEQSRYAELQEKVKEIKSNSNRNNLKSQLSEEVYNSVKEKDFYLAESYNERARRGKAFEADLSQYDEKTAETVKRAIDSGILNNTRRTHEFVDMVAKISADKGVLFDFTNNAKLKESGFAVDGASINGYVTKDGITVNISSSKATNSIVGHEITHVLEGTELYGELQKAIFDYARTKGEYHKRRADLVGLYKNVEGVDYSAELTADLVGDYLFTDEDFINNLSTKHRNVFQKIYDEIKYLYKIATAGSKEARELEKVKRAFDKAYRANGNTSGDTKYSLSDSDGKKLTKEQSEFFKDSKMRDENGNLKVMYHGSQDAGFHEFNAKFSDDDTSFFFVDSNDVAASYSGTSETYEAQTIRTAEDMNNFIESIGVEGYEVVEKDGKFTLLYEGDRIADSKTAKGIYEEFCWYEGVGEGDANYKVYLNLKNPLEVDAEGRNWNNISREFSQEVYGRYKSLTAEEKAALSNLAEWGEYSIFRDEMLEARATAEQGGSGVFDEAYTKNLARAYEKLGGANANLYDAFSVAQENFSEESLKEFAVKQMNTRDYAKKAKAEGYDGVIFKNIHDNGGYSNGSEGASTVAIAFESNQIKSVANEKPTSNPDIRFSLSESVEETKDLIAVHNLSEEKLAKSLNLGGLPMPSIAIARAKDGHSNFGNISLVFNKETIDPQFMRSNKVYSGDAWTPTYPRVEYKLNDKALKQIRDKISSLVSYDVLTDVGNAHLDSDNMTDTLNRFGGNVAEAFKNDDGLKYAYLKDTGANITLPMKEKNLSYYGYRENGAIIRVAEALSAEELQQALNSGAEAAEKIEPIVRSAVAEYMQEKYGNEPELLDLMMPKEKLTFSDLNGYIMEARNYHRNGVQQTVDTQAARELIREQVNQAKYENWLKNLFSNIVEKEGIRNEKDLFTPSGNRRSFEALHYEHNLENVIKAMKEKGDKGIGAWGGGNIFGAATTEYGSISEIKAEAQNRMKVMSESEYEEIRKGFSDRFFELAHSLPIHKDSFVATDDAANMLIEAVAKYKTKSGMATYLRNESKGWANYSDYVVDDLMQLVSEIRSMPVGYFEAKPQRAVGFNEVAAAIIPDSTNAELKQILTDKGIPFIEYESGNEQARLEALNSLEEAKFSLSKEGETPKRYGNYNIFGEDIKLEAPTQEEVAPIQEDVAPESEVVAKNAIPTEDVAPMPNEPTIYDLEQKQAELEDIIRKAMENNDPNAPKLIDEYGELLDSIAKRKAEESTMESERLASLVDADVPPELEAPYYDGSADSAPENPFEDRDIKAVGNRKVKAYMYENPEVKPFFQEEANRLLGELDRAEPAQSFYNGWLKYEMGYDAAQDIPEVYRVKRSASPSIVDLRENVKLSYDDIRKGLNAIIEDNGAENIAAAKKIEFELNKRLMEGYVDDTGYDVPPNQDYINLLKVKQITEYSEEARAKFLEEADKYAPPMEDIAPIAENTTVDEPIVDAPIAEAYEAIKPKKEKNTEPRLKRVKEGEQSPNGKERKWVGTSTESEAVDGKILPDDLDQEAIHYQPISNKKTLDTANAKLDGMGYESSLAYFNSQFANKKTTVEDIVLGERLIQEAIKRGDTKTAGELIEDVAILGTELGQKVQALSIIKRLTPEGQLRMLQRTVERGKTREDKAYEGVEITQEMIDKILKAYNEDGSFDQTKLNEAVEDAKQKIADQMKVSKMDKVNAWRYLSMLGNPKTHIRNLVSNVAMRGTTAVKNVVARTIETVAPIENRTKTWKKASDEVKAFSQKTAAEMQDVLSDGGKYNEDASIKQKRAIFKNKILNGVYEFNSDMLSKEDWWFSKPAFTNALSEYLTANGINTAQDIENNPKIVAKAKKYATEQSQIATFRQYSWLANKINEIEHKNVATEIAIGAVLPFKKTPINIAKTALNYSPLGFAKTLTYDASQVKNGKMEASELVDHLAQNVTGSALVLIGYMLANAGFLNGAGEDDKEGKYDYQLGEQAYSINIGNATFSLSWLSPIAMPLFVGANAYEQLVEGKEWNGNVVVETLAQTLDPLSEMSFLSSLDSVLSSYDSGIEKFAGIAQSAAQSYTTQFVPTLSSQVAAVMDDTKRSTKVAADSDFKFVDETVNKLKYKIPFLRETLEPSTDIWGNDVKQTEDFMERAFETFIAPYAKKKDISSGVDEEIKALYGETGDAGLIPSIPYNYINYDGKKYEMSASEYTEYKKLYGQNAYELMSDLFNTSTYKAASSEERADMVNRIYDFARDEAKREYFAKYGIEFTNATKDGEEYYKENSIKGAIEYDMTPDEYEFVTENPEKYKFFEDVGLSYEEYKNGSEDFKDAYSWAFKNPEKFTVSKAVASDVVTYRKYASDLYDIKADKDEDGKSISGSRKEKVIDYVNNLDIDYGARLILFKSEYNADDTYNYDIIDYLNNRQDISYEEMETILKELGFIVRSDGTIQWD